MRMPAILIQTAAWITFVFAAFEFFAARYPESFPPSTGIYRRHQKLEPSSLPPLEKECQPAGKRRSFTQAVAEVIIGSLLLAWLLLIPSHPFL